MKLLIPHLVVPSRNIAESVEFYETLGCRAGRQDEKEAIINFFGSQLVIEHSAILDSDPLHSDNNHPRCFGLVLNSSMGYVELETIMTGYLIHSYFKGRIHKSLHTRYEGKFEEHKTISLVDPSNNLIEMKAYKNSMAIFDLETSPTDHSLTPPLE